LQALVNVDNEDLDKDITNQTQAVWKVAEGIPIIMVDETGEISGAYNFGDSLSDKQLDKRLKNIKENGPEPIVNEDPYAGYAKYLYYSRSRTLKLLSYFPLIQILLLGVFVGISYFGFVAARKEQQNRIWVGMAKETAHQLGTPISAIIAWIELLKSMDIEDDEVKDILKELGKDVHRLELIADRFSKIGSAPELSPHNLNTSVEKSFDYMKRRAPKKVEFKYDAAPGPVMVKVNPPIFEWVLENLIRNALDAIEGKGIIKLDVIDLGHEVQIDVHDNGRGIPSNKHQRIFDPGYSTKKRGWGLGLSLAKRIIEQYHNGEIFVKKSEPGEGTVISIVLPKAK
jgi:signal transduction histidine kinase